MHDPDTVESRPVRVLVVDDDPNIRSGLSLALGGEGFEVASHARWDGKARSELPACSLVLLDVYIGSQDGHAVLREIVALDPLMPVVMISGQASPEEAAGAIREGAFDFVEKPFSHERITLTARNAARYRELNAGVVARTVPVRASAAMQGLCAEAARFARSGAPVLVRGESGTGKDVLAGLLHSLSPRSEGPFVKINCGAISDSLADSELFGHARGAFTGAERDYSGRIAAADGGTLFLDEVGELPLDTQVKLLRFLETGELQRVGEAGHRRANVRIIAATNRDLLEAAERSAFRKDLYFRLAVLCLAVPPLRERPEDVAPLAAWFLEIAATRDGLRPPALDAEALRLLEEYPWPGNARELRNVAERLLCMVPGELIDREAVAAALRDGPARESSSGTPGGNPGGDSLLERPMPLAEAKEALERAYIETQYRLHGQSVKETALALGLLPNNLSRRMKQLGIASS